MKRLIVLSLLLLGQTLARSADAQPFKAYADGKKDATEAIQDAIDRCSNQGGGELVLPPGTYLCGTLKMRSHVSLVLSRGAVLKGHLDYAHRYEKRAFILCEGIEDFSICGEGTIDGQSDRLDFEGGGFKNNDKVRPYIMLLQDCRDFAVRDVHLVNSARWTLRIRDCEKGIVDRVTIRSLSFINNDGIDIDGRDITVSNCIINSDDDAICLKSDNPERIVENITITNCIVASNSNAIKFGTASKGGFRNISISNCVVRANPVSPRRNIWEVYRNIEPGTLAGLSGIAIESVDGGLVEHISISNIAMSGITSPIFLCLGRRHGAGILRHILISNVTAVTEGVLPCVIAGLPEKKIENVQLSNINIVRKSADVRMPENPKESPTSYPEARMYGHRNPACGIYARHVDGLHVDNFTVTVLGEGEERPVVVLDDVTGERLERFTFHGTSGPLLERR
ncbi:MAG: hypothetical protein IJV01_00675 [Bacteroidales bacterium]|nr:hypothetical protein [Bacteroidales bacterium]